jgi:hypothetical protein
MAAQSNVNPGKTLRLRGALGPFRRLAVDGALTWKIEPAADGTNLSVTYALAVTAMMASRSWRQAGDGVLTAQVGRLKTLIESRSPGH